MSVWLAELQPWPLQPSRLSVASIGFELRQIIKELCNTKRVIWVLQI